MAANHKRGKINRAKYAEEVSKEIEYPLLSVDELSVKFLNDFKTRYKHEFDVDEFNQNILSQLIYYFTNNERFEGDLGKGIYLVGNPGCGKSSMMRVLGFNTRQPFAFKSCIEIAKEYSNDGYPAIERYNRLLQVSKRLYFGFEQIGWCFDDLGFEEKGKHYGKEAEVMTEILERIYNNPDMKGNVHITSNISGDQVEERYGNRVRSRMREMFNMIAFDESSPDRRS